MLGQIYFNKLGTNPKLESPFNRIDYAPYPELDNSRPWE
ncbi:hypothetical protein HNP72_002576 [Sphingobacterium soli]|nr:hypothetical protein [Sphingobacterium soli]